MNSFERKFETLKIVAPLLFPNPFQLVFSNITRRINNLTRSKSGLLFLTEKNTFETRSNSSGLKLAPNSIKWSALRNARTYERDDGGGGISQVFERVVPKKRRREGGGGRGDGGEEGGKGPSERGAFSKLNNSGSH